MPTMIYLPLVLDLMALLHSATATSPLFAAYTDITECESKLNGYYSRQFGNSTSNNFCATGMDGDVVTGLEAWFDEYHVFGLQIYFPHNVTRIVGSQVGVSNTTALSHTQVSITQNDTIRHVTASVPPQAGSIQGIGVELSSGQMFLAGNTNNTGAMNPDTREYTGLAGISGRYGMNGIEQISYYLIESPANGTVDLVQYSKPQTQVMFSGQISRSHVQSYSKHQPLLFKMILSNAPVTTLAIITLLTPSLATNFSNDSAISLNNLPMSKCDQIAWSTAHFGESQGSPFCTHQLRHRAVIDSLKFWATDNEIWGMDMHFTNNAVMSVGDKNHTGAQEKRLYLSPGDTSIITLSSNQHREVNNMDNLKGLRIWLTASGDKSPSQTTNFTVGKFDAATAKNYSFMSYPRAVLVGVSGTVGGNGVEMVNWHLSTLISTEELVLPRVALVEDEK
ncbi:uncharacterized protein EI97DRAFT_442901 [Westerdykella ornata]|uniref:Jacalin-type lectin domain-containing protein n=1 Tax=Westerdykella ornata TaxID=318751 RepID=A0A6A6JHQ9_WESOR|nr:uncharacterized protein EI97DRAFT_442901 [Westerdykella ornata]KAF2275927.1 hypothetical protein EI97DRAFT_442901 [Westerdykella ornata]